MLDCQRNRLDMRRRGAATAAHHVKKPRLRKVLQDLGHVGWRLIIAAKFIGQAGIRVQTDEGVGDTGQVFDIRPQIVRAQRAIEPDEQRFGMTNGVPERFGGLAGQGAPAAVRDRAGNHHRHPFPGGLEEFFYRVNGRLAVQRIEDGFDQQQVGAAIQQTLDRFGVTRLQFGERDIPETWVVNGGGH